ncbi:hypothetical protein OG413_41240 [Streptomyces sp. NBC_01433]|uniref:hypothetical protein n=1 Tax=Streptomyces sp. NBC_01433 TaxID=2903864 RepID=UPI002250D4E0|nr:hypothetical protein [Streptomyces sp. NBC_01433]MCX4681629.1 hypothetical protein [Streptomyces sp. NBC_01433]
MLYDDRGTTAQRLARELALAVMESAVTATALAAATTSGTAAYRRVPAHYGHYVRLAAAFAAAITGGTLVDALLDVPTFRIRRRLNGLGHSTPPDSLPSDIKAGASSEAPSPEQGNVAPELSDAEVLQQLERSVASDAAIRAANHGWCRTIDENLLSSRKHWQGHPDGTASLPLVAGCTLHFEPRSPAEAEMYPDDWRYATFVLDDNGTRAAVATPAALLAHLTGQNNLLDTGLDDDDPYAYDAFELADFDADSDGGT